MSASKSAPVGRSLTNRLSRLFNIAPKRPNSYVEFPLPASLNRLIDACVWPSKNGPSMEAQNLRPLVSADRVRHFASDESIICLQPPPFHTIAQEVALGGAGDFWERFGALDQIMPEKAVIIADFGLGSDSPVILDFGQDSVNPPVLRLQWTPDKRNQWVQGAKHFDEFIAVLGLSRPLNLCDASSDCTRA